MSLPQMQCIPRGIVFKAPIKSISGGSLLYTTLCRMSMHRRQMFQAETPVSAGRRCLFRGDSS